MAAPLPTLNADRREGYRMAYVVGEADLAKLDALITEAAGCAPTYTASLADDSTVRFPDLETLLKFENSTNREIEGIELSAKERNYIRVTLQDDERADTVLLTASGNDQDLYPFSGAFKAWRESVKVNSSWFASITPEAVSLVLGMGIWGTCLIQMAKRVPKDAPIGLAVALVVGGVLISFLAAYGAIRAKTYFFPMSTFALGYGVKRAKNRVMIRNFVAGPVVVAIVVGVVANYLFFWAPK